MTDPLIAVAVGFVATAVVVALALIGRELDKGITDVLNGPMDQRDVNLRCRQILHEEGLT